MKKLFFLLLLLPFCAISQQYSLQTDAAALREVEEITNLIYNNQHSQVQRELLLLKATVPHDHPVFPMLQALNLYWKDAPMHSGAPHFKEFKGYLQETVKKSQLYLQRGQDQTLVNFLALSAHSLLTRFHADKGDYMAAVGEAKNAYSFMKKGFDLKEEYSEFYFPVGLYNYYREKYPELHPVYRPFMFFFRSGDIPEGLQQLEYSVRNNIFTKPEAGVFLVHIYLYYENKPAAALRNMGQLQKEYPENRFFKAQLAEVLLANRQYSRALPYIEFLLTQTAPYYKMAGELFMGIYQEKKAANPELAREYFLQALNTSETLGYMADVYRSMAFAGLGRHYHQQEEKAKAREAYEKALALANYEYPVKQEARQYLD